MHISGVDAVRLHGRPRCQPRCRPPHIMNQANNHRQIELFDPVLGAKNHARKSISISISSLNSVVIYEKRRRRPGKKQELARLSSHEVHTMKALPLLSRSLGSLFTPDLISRPTLTKSLHNLRRYSSSVDLAGAVSDPLRILFCGSDTFSCASLRALHSEHAQNSKLVEALEVMVLPPRRTGRGLKQLREVPCRAVAEELGLRVHQRETFRKWDLPDGTNLVVVVSFGLFVPARILRSAKYGGVNVHPSLLPDLRGPAPIHHAMLRGDSHVGISLQTLDDKAFDHGTVLAQTPAPGLPIHPGASLHEVIDDAAAAGAEMLVQGLRNGLHIPPHQSVAGRSIPGLPLTHAPKVTKADSEVDWDAWASVGDFARRIRVFSSVWTRTVLADGHAEKRLLFLDAEEVTEATAAGEEYSIAFAHGDGRRTQRTVRVGTDGSCTLHLAARSWLRVRRVRVDGKRDQDAAKGLAPFLASPRAGYRSES
ncbi:hypothetical protein RJ55_01121 [Drechmeria coniospora]|nr:hypothetical protein RJ55_01121 [Drechmeria coniospora]